MSAAQGRFTTPDWAEQPEPVPYASFDDPQSLNLYGYVRNNPVNNRDLDGHVCFFGFGSTCAKPPQPPPDVPIQNPYFSAAARGINRVWPEYSIGLKRLTRRALHLTAEPAECALEAGKWVSKPYLAPADHAPDTPLPITAHTSGA